MKTEKTVILGDSISTTNFSRGGYQDMIEKSLGIKIVVNLAENYSALSSGYPSSVLDRLNLTEGDVFADCVIFWAGTNDWAYNVPIDEFECSVKSVLDLISEKYPYAELVFCTPIYRFSPLVGKEENLEAFICKNDVGCTLKDYSDVIKKCVPNGSLCDTDSLCGIDKTNFAEYLRDGIHPSCKGYEVIAKVISNFIENI